jgi:hypothetical protein
MRPITRNAGLLKLALTSKEHQQPSNAALPPRRKSERVWMAVKGGDRGNQPRN